jgi:very-short-patch-repair endonuclease
MREPPPGDVIRRLARGQRGAPSAAEDMLWTILRDRRIKQKFRRQTPIGPYIADFVCMERRLIVEVDGPHHAEPEQAAKDAARDDWLRANAFNVLRLTSDEIIGSPELAALKVIATLELPIPRRRP